jgi:hypothetical protein
MKYQKLKHYLVSSLITFLAAFISATIPFIEKIDFYNLEMGAIFGVFLAILNVTLRAGFKALLEKWLQKLLKM